MITEEERQEIINAAVEKTLLMIPEVVGNLMTNQAVMMKLNKQFYTDHPEFAKDKMLTASVIERVDGENPGMDYKEVLAKAIPLIREQMNTSKSLNMTTVVKPNRNLNGVL